MLYTQYKIENLSSALALWIWMADIEGVIFTTDVLDCSD